MASDEKKEEWKGTLEGRGYPLDGIDLQDNDMMVAVYKVLSIAEDGYSEKAQLRSFLKQQQQQQQSNEQTSTERKRKLEHSSPGSKNTESRVAFGALMESIENSGMDWSLNGNIKSRDSLLADPRADNKLMEHLGLDDTHVLDDPAFEVDFTLLGTQSEPMFQSGHLKENFFDVQCAHALDLSSSTTDGPFFKPPQAIVGLDNSRVYVQTGKPDGTSGVAPMDLEIKSDSSIGSPTTLDWAVLNQAVERVVVRMHLSGYLKFAVAFAVTGRSAWCVLGKRVFRRSGAGSSEKQIVSLVIERVEHVWVRRLWLGITRKSQTEPTFFLTEDGPVICASLKSVDAPPWLCRVKWLASSTSRVYAVTTPKYYMWGGNSKTVGINVAPGSATYALKVVRTNNDYEQEVAALTAVARETASKNLEFYALGCFAEQSGSICFEGHDSWTALEIDKPSHTETYWWGADFRLDGIIGGVFFMRVGIDDSTVRWTDLVDGACESLRLAHSAGYLHCDIRRSNIMKFGNKWCLIDFGLSWALNESGVYVLEQGAQADGVGPRVRGCWDRQEEIHWTIGDDYEMLLTMLRTGN